MGEAGDEEEARAVEPGHTEDTAPYRRPRRLVLIGGVIALVVVTVAGSAVGLAVLRGGHVGGTLPNGVSVEQVKRDFVADQDAQSAALGSGDAGRAQGSISGNALQDLIKQIQVNDIAGAYQKTQLTNPTVAVVQEADPNDSQTNVEVHQTGYARNTLADRRTGQVVSQQDVKLDARYWLRSVSGRYAITDQQVSQQPGTPPQTPWALIAAGAGALAVGSLLVVILWRRRRPPLAPAPAPVAIGVSSFPETSTPPGLPTPLWAGGEGEGLGIRTIGGLQLWSGGKDLARTVLDSEVSGFIWLLLLVKAILNPESTTLDDDLAEEVFPKLPRKNQLSRRRGRLLAIRRFPKPLARRIQRDGAIIRFDLTGCQVDAIELLDLARSCARSAVLSPSTVQRAEQAVALTGGRFLPFWEGLDKKVTGELSGAQEPVDAIQGRLAIARADVLAALGATYVASGQTQRAVEVLNEARRMRPEREDVANQLVVAYRAMGRDAEAERVLDGTDVEL